MAKLQSDHLVDHRLGHPPVNILHGEVIGVRAIRPAGGRIDHTEVG
jgi:hypothetical protein